jgi:hypothetical protein
LESQSRAARTGDGDGGDGGDGGGDQPVASPPAERKSEVRIATGNL